MQRKRKEEDKYHLLKKIRRLEKKIISLPESDEEGEVMKKWEKINSHGFVWSKHVYYATIGVFCGNTHGWQSNLGAFCGNARGFFMYFIIVQNNIKIAVCIVKYTTEIECVYTHNAIVPAFSTFQKNK